VRGGFALPRWKMGRARPCVREGYDRTPKKPAAKHENGEELAKEGQLS